MSCKCCAVLWLPTAALITVMNLVTERLVATAVVRLQCGPPHETLQQQTASTMGKNLVDQQQGIPMLSFAQRVAADA